MRLELKRGPNKCSQQSFPRLAIVDIPRDFDKIVHNPNPHPSCALHCVTPRWHTNNDCVYLPYLGVLDLGMVFTSCRHDSASGDVTWMTQQARPYFSHKPHNPKQCASTTMTSKNLVGRLSSSASRLTKGKTATKKKKKQTAHNNVETLLDLFHKRLRRPTRPNRSCVHHENNGEQKNTGRKALLPLP